MEVHIIRGAEIANNAKNRVNLVLHSSYNRDIINKNPKSPENKEPAMEYRPELIALSSEPRLATPMYSLVLLKAASVSCTLSGVRCYLDGHYLLCLNDEDVLTIHAGRYDLLNF